MASTRDSADRQRRRVPRQHGWCGCSNGQNLPVCSLREVRLRYKLQLLATCLRSEPARATPTPSARLRPFSLRNIVYGDRLDAGLHRLYRVYGCKVECAVQVL
ncbi:hypothetical protein EJ06DRAFT_529794 [Trichodelitschia bisporula]|uniref:Uncharacterized protein n=1 Tax=Trichodelitschia bisporula TaxID=703511 RepID=A0A6G1HXW2_9PEZI|nr:hypothetical protein EJ06DRAFT_529794 [Trichodelitschia bisporula]